MDAAIIFSDILIVPYALGQNVDFKKSEGPVLEKLSNISKFCDFNIKTFHNSLGPVYETISLVKEELDNNTALIGFCGAPWTIATYIIEGSSTRDFTRVMSFAFSQPDTFQNLLSLLVEASFHYLNKQIASGVEVIQIFDSWAGVLNEKEFRQWVIKPTKAIIQRLHAKHPHIPIIGFPRQAGPLYTDYIKETGVTAISLDQTTSVSWVAKKIQPLCAVQGNLDPHVLVAGGEAMKESLKEILSTLGKAPFIFNLGHGILPTTPPEHVAELTAFIRSWSQKT
jgi:uroporphyrinogen decarboxylase